MRPISCVLRREVSSSSPARFSSGVTRSLMRFRTCFLVAQAEAAKDNATARLNIAIALSFIVSSIVVLGFLVVLIFVRREAGAFSTGF